MRPNCVLSDVYDALTTRRVYKPAYSHEVAREIILDGRGTHFDPDVVDAFMANEEHFITVKDQLEDQLASCLTNGSAASEMATAAAG